ncbi:uncharacterized protein BXIN_1546 [Babesia sp. Xinjiang]|uniref:uncharacterized protein n=1 Tax=Babesia sp. Xinjiang TaxID=462227 RepID=UPI000A24B2FE|nr:uncharacterized protein BXIN_1546 [Babesia sp. Xinjiang]ORM42305.1 hypothetical protein BXIN_1546 [Babesia sp. Xinjiang]
MQPWPGLHEVPVTIDRGSARRDAAVLPPLKLYNPSRIIGATRLGSIPKYRFCNPFMPANVMRAVCFPVLTQPGETMADANVSKDEYCPLAYRRADTVGSIFRRNMNECNRWIFGDISDLGCATGIPNENGPVRDIMEMCKLMIDTANAELHPWNRDWWMQAHNPGTPPGVQYCRRAVARKERNSIGKQSYPANNDTWYNENLRLDLDRMYNTAVGAGFTDDGKCYKMTFRLPSVNRDDVKVRIYGGVLTVSIKSEEVNYGKNDSTTRYSQQFRHSVTVPRDAMEPHAKATLTNGTLTVQIPKRCDRIYDYDNY